MHAGRVILVAAPVYAVCLLQVPELRYVAGPVGVCYVPKILLWQMLFVK